MIIELFGLPGCGKSYICDKIHKKFKYNDILYFYKEKFVGKVFFHIYINLMLLNPNIRFKFFKLKKIIGTNYYNNKIDNNSKLDTYIKYMLFISYIENRYKNKSIIIDEGIIHYCMVLYAEFTIPLYKIKKIIEYFDEINHSRKIVFGVDLSKNIAVERIKKRNRKRTPIDFLSDDKLNEVLESYQDFMNKIKLDFTIENEERILEIVGGLE